VIAQCKVLSLQCGRVVCACCFCCAVCRQRARTTCYDASSDPHAHKLQARLHQQQLKKKRKHKNCRLEASLINLISQLCQNLTPCLVTAAAETGHCSTDYVHHRATAAATAAAAAAAAGVLVAALVSCVLSAATVAAASGTLGRARISSFL
jgi:hypothetical protein